MNKEKRSVMKNGRVFLVTEQNKEKLENENLVVFSDDRKYALRYTKELIDEITFNFEANEYLRFKDRLTLEDRMYFALLFDSKAETDYRPYAEMWTAVDSTEELVLDFEIPMYGTVNKIFFLFNIEDAKSEGSEFIQCLSTDEKIITFVGNYNKITGSKGKMKHTFVPINETKEII